MAENLPTCYRCDEPIRPVNLSTDWPSRIRGFITRREQIVTHHIVWQVTRFGNVPSLSRPSVTHSELDLCDGCWGELLSWANAPHQDRARIAAENRRRAQREREVAEQCREREVAREMEQLEREEANRHG